MGIDTYLDKAKEGAMRFLVPYYLSMNIEDRNFFELVAALPSLNEIDGCLTAEEVKNQLEKVRKEVKERRSKL